MDRAVGDSVDALRFASCYRVRDLVVAPQRETIGGLEVDRVRQFKSGLNPADCDVIPGLIESLHICHLLTREEV